MGYEKIELLREAVLQLTEIAKYYEEIGQEYARRLNKSLKDNEDLQSELQVYKDKVSFLNGNLTDAREEITKLRNNRIEQDSKLRALQRRNDELEEDKTRVEHQYAEAKEDRRKARDKEAQYRRERDDAISSVKKKNDKIEELEQRLADAESRIGEMKNENAQLQEKRSTPDWTEKPIDSWPHSCTDTSTQQVLAQLSAQKEPHIAPRMESGTPPTTSPLK